MTEVMGHDRTDPAVFDQVMDFAQAIRMIPLPVRKEKAGYLLNSMLVPLLFSGMDLYVTGVWEPARLRGPSGFWIPSVCKRRTTLSRCT